MSAAALYILALCAALAQPSPDAAPRADAPQSRRERDRTITRAFDEHRYEHALQLLRERAAENPRDPATSYNLACALAMTGRRDEAAQALLSAISWGFTDLFHMDRDPHLEPLRDHPDYRAVILGWGPLLDARGAAELDTARQVLGPAYTTHVDQPRRINFLSAVAPSSFEAAVRETELVSRFAAALGMPQETDADRPDAWALVLLPTPADFLRFIGQPGVGGYYDRDRRRLVTQDTGPSLRHEFFHVLHWRHMERLGQRHPLWIMEGLASLLEDGDPHEDTFLPAPSWRTNIVKRLEAAGRLPKWRQLFALERQAFMGTQSRAHYAHARAIFLYLHQQRALAAWYRAYTDNFPEDESGILAITRALGRPADQCEADFRAWLRTLPTVAETGKPSGAGLGVALDPGSGDGPVVTSFQTSAARAGGAGLRLRDVILSVQDRRTATLDDLHRVLGEHAPGDSVTVRVRRGRLELDVPVRLVDPEDRGQGWNP